MTPEKISFLRKDLPYLCVYDKLNLEDFNEQIDGSLESIAFEIIQFMTSQSASIVLVDPQPVCFLFYGQFIICF